MKRLLPLILICASCECLDDKPSDVSVIRGQRADRYAATVNIIFDVDAQCTATRVGKKELLTAAHCIRNVWASEGWNRFKIRTDGDMRRGYAYSSEREIKPWQIASHPGFDMLWTSSHRIWDMKYDVAIIRVEKESDIPSNVSIKPLVLNLAPPTGSVTFAGWGYQGKTDAEWDGQFYCATGVPQEIRPDFNDGHGEQIRRNFFSIWDVSEHPTLPASGQGDSGGAVYDSWGNIIGVVSHGNGRTSFFQRMDITSEKYEDETANQWAKRMVETGYWESSWKGVRTRCGSTTRSDCIR